MLKRLCFAMVLSLCSANIYASERYHSFAALEEEVAPDLSDYLFSKDFKVPEIFLQLRFIVDMSSGTKEKELVKPEYTFILSIKSYVEARAELIKKGKRQSELQPLREFIEKTEDKILSMIVKNKNDESEIQHWKERLQAIPGTQAAKDFLKYENAKVTRAVCAVGRKFQIAFGCMMGPITFRSAMSDSSDFDYYPSVHSRYHYDERYDDRKKLTYFED